MFQSDRFRCGRQVTVTMLKEMTSLILKHTVATRNHLTPELVLRLITPACPLWRATEAEVPFKDPFWAFYWPGGQATARYILDNGAVVENRKVLDVGCGCGAGSIAAVKMKAKRVLANDIDTYAATATNINAGLNDVTFETSTENLIGDPCKEFDTILIGDMFYDEEFANLLFEWLHTLNGVGKTILIGDPGRHGLTDRRRQQMSLVARYELPLHSCMENHGFTHSTVWTINK
ncbi:electron transfer flavoprotein beta subunit lysine methyltransferase-like isoform X2 [Trichoplusia ni]|uniref:ETFB lysine methyltransferase n=1 Tax=Trichoplusia ni TaxID=7111 RepID=A0A7E5VS95_TRINI|nr:electron transfer flavoprotein beta subunit lysine methyltransferase-like isoform X2 [Trichoplusia ni]